MNFWFIGFFYCCFPFPPSKHNVTTEVSQSITTTTTIVILKEKGKRIVHFRIPISNNWKLNWKISPKKIIIIIYKTRKRNQFFINFYSVYVYVWRSTYIRAHLWNFKNFLTWRQLITFRSPRQITGIGFVLLSFSFSVCMYVCLDINQSSSEIKHKFIISNYWA